MSEWKSEQLLKDFVQKLFHWKIQCEGQANSIDQDKPVVTFPYSYQQNVKYLENLLKMSFLPLNTCFKGLKAIEDFKSFKSRILGA